MHKFKNKYIINLLYFVLITPFFLLYLSRLNIQVIRDPNVNLALLVPALIFSILTRFILSSNWAFMLRTFESVNISLIKAHHIYAKSWLGRYIPGKIVWVGGRILFSVQEGVSKRAATILSFLELAFQIQAGSLVAIFAILFIKNQTIRLFTPHLALLILILSILFLLPFTLSKLISFSYQILKKKRLSKKYLNLNKLIKILIFVTCAKLNTGLVNSLLAWSLKPGMNINELIYVAGVSNLAGILGMIAFFAPAGIGINEGTQIYLLKEIMAEEKLFVYVIFSRILSVIADITFYGITALLVTASKNNQRIKNA